MEKIGADCEASVCGGALVGAVVYCADDYLSLPSGLSAVDG